MGPGAGGQGHRPRTVCLRFRDVRQTAIFERFCDSEFPEFAMRTRPRSKFVKKLKARRCGSCGAKMNTLFVRCRRCSSLVARPKK